MSAIGEALSDALYESFMIEEELRYGGNGPEADACRFGESYGHAFRAAELAYDLGQQHAEERARRAKEDSWKSTF